MNIPKVSIIIPVYNVEKYIDECIESVVKQTIKEVEIILVDDGSPDRCPEKCDEWEKKDSRIRVIHKKNEGLGEARNSGLKVANGEYVYFLDSDDYILKDGLEKLYNIAVAEDADIVGSGIYRVNDSGEKKIHYVPDEFRVYRNEEIFETFIPDIIAPNPHDGHMVKFGTAVAGPLFSMKTIKDHQWSCRSEREIISEDIYSFLEYCEHVQCAVELPVFTSCYRVNEKSLSKSYHKDRFERNIDFYQKLMDLINGKKYEKYIKNRISRPFLNNTIECLKQVVKYEDNFKHRFDEFKNIINNDVLIDAITKYDFSKEKETWKILFFLIKNRFYCLSYVLIKMKSE